MSDLVDRLSRRMARWESVVWPDLDRATFFLQAVADHHPEIAPAVGRIAERCAEHLRFYARRFDGIATAAHAEERRAVGSLYALSGSLELLSLLPYVLHEFDVAHSRLRGGEDDTTNGLLAELADHFHGCETALGSAFRGAAQNIWARHGVPE